MDYIYEKTTKTLALICFLILIGCGKDNSLPIQGEGGNVTGESGSIIHSGTGMPDDGIGKTGDYYLDKESADLYGPKTSSGWGTPLNLKGAKGLDGAPGTSGTQIYNGEGQPQSSLGNVNDFYFDKTEVALYGPKSESGWGSPIHLRPANNGAAKIVIIKNHKFEEWHVTNDYSYYSFAGYLRNRFVPVPDYTDYYENGVVFVYYRQPDGTDGAWHGDIENEEVFYSNDSYHNGSLNAGYYFTFKYGKDHITVETDFNYRENDNNPPVENIKDLVAGHLKENFILDFKFVLISGTQVSAMQRQNIDVKNVQAVTDFFGD